MKIPNEISVCIDRLNSTLDYKMIEQIKICNEKELFKCHFGIGSYIRNIIYSEKELGIDSFFEKEGILHPDNMSSIVLQIYHSTLNNKDINLDDYINDCYRDLMWIMDRDLKGQ